MQDETLKNISLAVTAIGIISLLTLSYFEMIPQKGFNEITSDDQGSRVKVNGIITKVYMHNSSMTLRLRQECQMDVMVFEKGNYTVGDNLTVQGSVQEYNGKMEIIADKIIRK